jgi:hypothetical protein
MSGDRPIAVRRAVSRRRLTHDAPQREHDRADAVWLYEWSHAALRPTGDLLAARVTSPAVLRPSRKVSHISQRRRKQAH